MKKLTKTIVILLLLCLIVPACGYKDIDKRFFAVAIGIDYIEDNEETPYELTLALAVPSTKIEPKSAITQIETIQSANISDGLRQLKAKLDKELDLGHCKVIIIGEELANQDVSEVVHWIARRRDVQNIAGIAIGKPNASSIVSLKPESDRFPGNTLSFHFSRDTTESSYSYITIFTEMYKRIAEPGLDPVLPIIEAEKDNTYLMNTIALLDKEKVKLVLSPRETQLFNQLSNHLTNLSVFGSYEDEKVTVAINKIKTTYKINELQTEPTIQMRIKQQVVLEEMPTDLTGNFDTMYSDIITKLEQRYSEESTALFEKFQKEGLDPYGFGLRYRSKNPLTVEQFEQIWPELYKEISFEISTNMVLKSTGLIK